MEGDVARCLHRDLGGRVVFNRDDLDVVGLVAEAIRGHPGAVQHAAAAGSVGIRSLTHELNAHEVGIAVCKACGVRIESGSTSVFRVVAVVREEDHLIRGGVVSQPLVARVTGHRQVHCTGDIGRRREIITGHGLDDFRSHVALVIECDVVELDKLTLLTVGRKIAVRLERGDHITREAHGVLTCNGTIPAEPTGEAVRVAIVVVGTITQLEAEVLACRLVAEVDQRSEVPGARPTHGVGCRVVQGVHGPEVGVDRTTIVVLESTSPVGTDRAALEEEVDLEAEVVVILIHDHTGHRGGSVLELLEGHPTIGDILDEVMSTAHVPVHIIELEQGIGSVVEVGVVTGSDGIPALGSTSTRANLVAAIRAVLHRHHLIQFEVVASETGSIGSRCSEQVALAFHRVIGEISINFE